MTIRSRREKLPTLAVFEMRVGDHTTKVELDKDCLDKLSRRVYGEEGMANERVLGLLVHGFLSRFINCNEPSQRDKKDAAYQLGRTLGSQT